MSIAGSRPLDHVVLPVSSLDAATARLSLLGFTVAPSAQHPFGTENACVFFSDNTYLEPLAVASRETCEAQARAGNVFVARDQAYRFRRGQDGFSGLVFGTSDADGDDAAFRADGISAGDMLTFSRGFKTPDGAEATATFKLAFAADLRAPDAYFFTCERVNVPAVDRSALQRHDNNVAGIVEIVGCETNPTDFQYLLQTVARQRDVNAHSFGMDIDAANARISVLTPAGLDAFFAIAPQSTERGLHFEAIVFGVRDLAACRALLESNSVAYRMQGPRLVVDRAPGQGAVFAFQEM
jgi:hypothetical protein